MAGALIDRARCPTLNANNARVEGNLPQVDALISTEEIVEITSCVCVCCCCCCCYVIVLWWVTSVSPVFLVFGMNHRANNGSWDLILPTIKSPELLSNRCYSVYCVLWTTTNIYAFIQHTHGLTLLQANRHTWTQTRTKGKTVKTLAKKELFWQNFHYLFIQLY